MHKHVKIANGCLLGHVCMCVCVCVCVHVLWAYICSLATHSSIPSSTQTWGVLNHWKWNNSWTNPDNSILYEDVFSTHKYLLTHPPTCWRQLFAIEISMSSMCGHACVHACMHAWTTHPHNNNPNTYTHLATQPCMHTHPPTHSPTHSCSVKSLKWWRFII